jgi:predicted nucleotidyltransferase
MVTMEQIEDVGRRIVQEFHPQRVILFGSHANGTATEDSDVDLLVIMPFDGKSFRKSAEVLIGVHPPFPVDLLVRTPENIRYRLKIGDRFIRDVLAEGKVLYDADGARVGGEG